MKKLNKQLSLGILGAILMASSDFIMIYGDTSFSGNLAWLTNGVAEMDPNRLNIAMILALLAIPFYLIGLMGLKEFIKQSKNKKRYSNLVSLSMTPWLMLHLFYVMIIYVFNFMTTNNLESNYLVSESLFNNFSFLIILGEILILLPFIYLFYLSIKEETKLARISALNNPLIIYLVLKGITLIMPDIPFRLAFTNSLMSSAMIIFFIIYLILTRKLKF